MANRDPEARYSRTGDGFYRQRRTCALNRRDGGWGLSIGQGPSG